GQPGLAGKRHIHQFFDRYLAVITLRQRPDAATAVIAEDVFAVQLRILAAAVHQPADHAVVALHVWVFPKRRRLDALEVGWLLAYQPAFVHDQTAFAVAPLMIATGERNIDFFTKLLAHISHPELARHRIKRHTMWVAQPGGPELL